MKKISLALAFVLAIGFAFATQPRENPALNLQWFIYIGGPVNSPTSYQLTSGDPGCSERDELCAVRAIQDGSTMHPTQESLDAVDVNNPDDPNVRFKEVE